MDNENIVLIARLKVKPEAIEEIKIMALALAHNSRAEQGCINYDVHQAIDDETTFIWHETWAGKAAIDEHFAKPYFAEFSASAERAAAEPLQINLMKMITERA